ncbi:MAG: hypothetical protein A2X18_09830 [Bacteroidetes bacterium GWF2_40_14]|nr:MAG: hypothetical protein A2X18_09830 [Bacteroidetes bacterium GWF2_40_14]
MKIITYIFGILLFFACSQQDSYDGRITLKNLENCKDSLTLTDINARISFVPLESRKECLIGNIQKLVLSSEYFFIWSKNVVYQFLRNGTFVRCIGNYGRGPEEYLDIYDIAVNEKQEKVFIADEQKVLDFNFAGEYCSTYQAKFWWKFEVSDEGNFLINPIIIFGNEPNKLIVRDMKGDTLAMFNNAIRFEPKNISMWPQLKSLSRLENMFIFHQQFCDTIFTLNPVDRSLTYRYSFDFGDFKITEQTLNEGGEAHNKVISVTGITEDLKYIYVDIRNRGKQLRYVIEKHTGKCHLPCFKIPELQYNFWPKWQYHDNILIDYISASYLAERNDSLSKTNIDSRLKKLDENSNPVLIIVETHN